MPAGAVVALVGAATFSIGLASTLATVLDLIVEPGVTQGQHWWQERLALFALAGFAQ